MATKKGSARAPQKKAVRDEPKVAANVLPGRRRVVVQGLASRMQVFNLPHDVYCAAMGECSCTDQEVVVTVYSRVDKGREPRLVRKVKKMNPTLTVRYRQRVAVPVAALQCPEVKSALANRWLRVTS